MCLTLDSALTLPVHLWGPLGRVSPCVFSYLKRGQWWKGRDYTAWYCVSLVHSLWEASDEMPVVHPGHLQQLLPQQVELTALSLDSSEETVRTPPPGGTVGCFSPSLLFLWLLWLRSLSTWSHTSTVSCATALWIARGKWSSLFWSLAMTHVLTLECLFYYFFILLSFMYPCGSQDKSHGIISLLLLLHGFWRWNPGI